MVGESGVGTYVAYAFIWAFLLLVVVIFARVVFTVSLLWLMPAAAVLRRLGIVGARRVESDVVDDGNTRPTPRHPS